MTYEEAITIKPGTKLLFTNINKKRTIFTVGKLEHSDFLNEHYFTIEGHTYGYCIWAVQKISELGKLLYDFTNV
jgi:hypothetical protein